VNIATSVGFAANGVAQLSISQDGSDLKPVGSGFEQWNNLSGATRAPFSYVWDATPNSAASHTYTLLFSISTGGTLNIPGNNDVASMILYEMAPGQ